MNSRKVDMSPKIVNILFLTKFKFINWQNFKQKTIK